MTGHLAQQLHRAMLQDPGPCTVSALTASAPLLFEQ